MERIESWKVERVSSPTTKRDNKGIDVLLTWVVSFELTTVRGRALE